MTDHTTTLTCTCGQVALAVLGRPIVSAECLCTDCQNAGAFLQSLPGARPTLDQKGATRFVLYRKDKVRCEQGQDRLREHRLSKDSKTRRVVAICCNTPMFLEFTDGHWLSIYGGLWPVANLPPLEIRTMARDRPKGVELPGDVPNPATHTVSFYIKLFRAWAAMRFRVPKVDFVNGELDAR
ncbi:hypothetical protein WKW79_18965 [Variovorax robiniae]|uniref:CENP-V/GFA domain-containing protein n=1 Tax=Variovorax robiniae TaxID=1836199 RepID=A0ABU8XAC7_9BURK